MEFGFLVPLAIFGGVVLGTMALYSLLVKEPRLVRERVERYEARPNGGAAIGTVSVLKDRRLSAIELAVGVVGFFLPQFYLSHRRSARVNKIINQLMDAISLIANSLKSGYSFSQGLEMVTKEMPPPVAAEFYQVLVEM